MVRTVRQYLTDLATSRLCKVLILPPSFIAHRRTDTSEQRNTSLASNCVLLALLQSHSERIQLYTQLLQGKKKTNNVLKCSTYRTKYLTCLRNRRVRNSPERVRSMMCRLLHCCWSPFDITLVQLNDWQQHCPQRNGKVKVLMKSPVSYLRVW